MKRQTYAEYLQKSADGEFSPLVKSDFDKLSDDEYREEAEKLVKCSVKKGDEDGGEEQGAEAEGEGEEEEEEEEEEGEEEEEEEKAKKAMELLPTEEELLKSMEYLAAAAASDPENVQAARLATLSKSASDGTLSDDGREELLQLLQLTAPGTPPETPLRKSLEEPASQEAVDASEFLAVFAESMVKSLEDLAGDVRIGRREQAAFNRQLAVGFDSFSKALVQERVADRQLIKALVDRVNALEHSPLPYRGKTAPPPTATLADVPLTGRDGAPIRKAQSVAQMAMPEVARRTRLLFNKSIQDGDTVLTKKVADAVIELETCRSDWRLLKSMRDPDMIRRIAEVG